MNTVFKYVRKDQKRRTIQDFIAWAQLIISWVTLKFISSFIIGIWHVHKKHFATKSDMFDFDAKKRIVVIIHASKKQRNKTIDAQKQDQNSEPSMP